MSNWISQAVAQRRQALSQAGQGPLAGEGLWGLALSGGGIRSATFCFGLLRALARDRLLLRFDLLSTVSGGGYIGAMLGRLLQRCQSGAETAEVVDRLAQADTRWFAWWLRANGRYLVPRGTRDTVYALGLYLRNMLAVHVELGILGLLLGLALAAVDLGAWALLDHGVQRHPVTLLAWLQQWLPAWLPTPWLLLVPLAWLAVVLACAYWAVPWAVGSLRRAAGAAVLAGLVVVLLLLGREQALGLGHLAAEGARKLLWLLATALAAAWVPAIALAYASGRHFSASAFRQEVRVTRPRVRKQLTSGLALLLQAAGVLLVLGALDRVAWWLAFDLAGDASLQRVATALALAAALLRALLPQFAALRARGRPGLLLRLGGLLGYLATFALLACWVALVHTVVLGSLPAFAGQATGRHLVLDFSEAWQAWAWVAVPALAYAALSGANVGFLNQSSLHSFYRARLTRAYLGAANPQRFGRPGALGATEVMQRTAEATQVTEVQPDDDLAMADYAPQQHGGPVHLIGICLNQTRDPRGGLYNQDRRGQALTVAPGGHLRVGRQDWQKLRPRRALSLGAWTAISGAAIAPGLGALTRGGISALALFGGLRLGFWFDSSATRDEAPPARRPWAKLTGLVRETVGNFDGPEGRDWFLTDGGHFENTGAYALLAEEAEVVVLADCGADPDYAFSDLENLVRKARIDLQAEVRFLKPKGDDPQRLNEAAAQLLAACGSLAELGSNDSNACFAVARISYRRSGRSGMLILVKPNLCRGLPVDLFNFKQQQPDFPQQSTADQFFDEAQWESYFQLGNVLGQRLTKPAIQNLATHAEACFVNDDGSPVEAALLDSQLPPLEAAGAKVEQAVKAAGETMRRIPQRIAAGSVTATLGVGAVITAGVTAWQAIESVRSGEQQRQKDERDALKTLTDQWAAIDERGAPTQTVQLAASLARLSDSLCARGAEASWFTQSQLAQDILSHTRQRCQEDPTAAQSAACRWLLPRTDAQSLQPVLSCLAVSTATLSEIDKQPCQRYWGYDYSKRADPACAHPADPDVRYRLARAEEQATEEVQMAAAQSEPAPIKVEPAAVAAPPAVASTAAAAAAAAAADAAAAAGPATAGASSTATTADADTVARAAPAKPAAPGTPATASTTAAKPSAVARANGRAGANAGEAAGARSTADTPANAGADARATVPAAETAPDAEPPPTATAEAAATGTLCAGNTVYIQIFSAAQRNAVREAWRQPWRALGASVPPIEDVRANAAARGRTAPLPVTVTTVRYHDLSALPCARQLAPAVDETGWRIEPLSPALKPTRGVIEVWVSPSWAPRREAAR